MKKDLEKELEAIKERNKKVEADKAWEVSITRRGIIAVFTYVALGIFLKQINAPNPWLTALVPAAAYVLSTMTLPFSRISMSENQAKSKFFANFALICQKMVG